MLRRLEKRIIVDLPSVMARRSMFEHYLPPEITNKSSTVKMTSNINYDFLSEVNVYEIYYVKLNINCLVLILTMFNFNIFDRALFVFFPYLTSVW